MSKQEDLINSLEKLRQVEEKNLTLSSNFIRGIVSGFGFFIGSAIIISIIVYILSLSNSAPVVGKYVNDVLIEVQRLQHK